MSIADNAFNATLKREQERYLKKREPICGNCAELQRKLNEARELGLYWQAEAERLMEIIDEETKNGIL